MKVVSILLSLGQCVLSTLSANILCATYSLPINLEPQCCLINYEQAPCLLKLCLGLLQALLFLSASR